MVNVIAFVEFLPHPYFHCLVFSNIFIQHNRRNNSAHKTPMCAVFLSVPLPRLLKITYRCGQCYIWYHYVRNRCIFQHVRIVLETCVVVDWLVLWEAIKTTINWIEWIIGIRFCVRCNYLSTPCLQMGFNWVIVRTRYGWAITSNRYMWMSFLIRFMSVQLISLSKGSLLISPANMYIEHMKHEWQMKQLIPLCNSYDNVTSKSMGASCQAMSYP